MALYIFGKLFFLFTGIVGIGVLIFFHELGHYTFCKIFGVHTPTFSIGFGPKLLSKKIGRTEFVLSAIPLGGYCEIAGHAEIGQGTQSEVHSTADAFFSKPYYQKLLIMLGGILFNLIFAYSVFVTIHLIGIPGSTMMYAESAIPIVETTIPESAADNIFQSNDQITAVNGIQIKDSITEIAHIIEQAEGPMLSFDIIRNDQPITVELDLCKNKDQRTYAGLIFKTEKKPGKSIVQSLTDAFNTTYRFTKNTGYAYLNLFNRKGLQSIGGPIKIISLMSQGASDGLVVFLLFLAVISINLAVFNLIPVPILDGGQILIVSLEALIGKTLPLKTKEYIFIGTWVIFLVLIAFLSIKDIYGIVAPYIGCIK